MRKKEIPPQMSGFRDQETCVTVPIAGMGEDTKCQVSVGGSSRNSDLYQEDDRVFYFIASELYTRKKKNVKKKL